MSCQQNKYRKVVETRRKGPQLLSFHTCGHKPSRPRHSGARCSKFFSLIPLFFVSTFVLYSLIFRGSELLFPLFLSFSSSNGGNNTAHCCPRAPLPFSSSSSQQRRHIFVSFANAAFTTDFGAWTSEYILVQYTDDASGGEAKCVAQGTGYHLGTVPTSAAYNSLRTEMDAAAFNANPLIAGMSNASDNNRFYWTKGRLGSAVGPFADGDGTIKTITVSGSTFTAPPSLLPTSFTTDSQVLVVTNDQWEFRSSAGSAMEGVLCERSLCKPFDCGFTAAAASVGSVSGYYPDCVCFLFVSQGPFVSQYSIVPIQGANYGWSRTAARDACSSLAGPEFFPATIPTTTANSLVRLTSSASTKLIITGGIKEAGTCDVAWRYGARLSGLNYTSIPASASSAAVRAPYKYYKTNVTTTFEFQNLLASMACDTAAEQAMTINNIGSWDFVTVGRNSSQVAGGVPSHFLCERSPCTIQADCTPGLTDNATGYYPNCVCGCVAGVATSNCNGGFTVKHISNTDYSSEYRLVNIPTEEWNDFAPACEHLNEGNISNGWAPAGVVSSSISNGLATFMTKVPSLFKTGGRAVMYSVHTRLDGKLRGTTPWYTNSPRANGSLTTFVPAFWQDAARNSSSACVPYSIPFGANAGTEFYPNTFNCPYTTNYPNEPAANIALQYLTLIIAATPDNVYFKEFGLCVRTMCSMYIDCIAANTLSVSGGYRGPCVCNCKPNYSGVGCANYTSVSTVGPFQSKFSLLSGAASCADIAGGGGSNASVISRNVARFARFANNGAPMWTGLLQLDESDPAGTTSSKQRFVLRWEGGRAKGRRVYSAAWTYPASAANSSSGTYGTRTCHGVVLPRMDMLYDLTAASAPARVNISQFCNFPQYFPDVNMSAAQSPFVVMDGDGMWMDAIDVNVRGANRYTQPATLCEQSPCAVGLDCYAPNTEAMSGAMYPCTCTCRTGAWGRRCEFPINITHGSTGKGSTTYVSQYAVVYANATTSSSSGGRRGTLLTTPMTFPEATAACAALQGGSWHLATLPSTEAVAVVAYALESDAWIGLDEGRANWAYGRLANTPLLNSTSQCAPIRYRALSSGSNVSIGGACDFALNGHFAMGRVDASAQYSGSVGAVVCERSPCKAAVDCDPNGALELLSSNAYFPNCGCVCRKGYVGARCDRALTATKGLTMTASMAVSLTVSADGTRTRTKAAEKKKRTRSASHIFTRSQTLSGVVTITASNEKAATRTAALAHTRTALIAATRTVLGPATKTVHNAESTLTKALKFTRTQSNAPRATLTVPAGARTPTVVAVTGTLTSTQTVSRTVLVSATVTATATKTIPFTASGVVRTTLTPKLTNTKSVKQKKPLGTGELTPTEVTETVAKAVTHSHQPTVTSEMTLTKAVSSTQAISLSRTNELTLSPLGAPNGGSRTRTVTLIPPTPPISPIVPATATIQLTPSTAPRSTETMTATGKPPSTVTIDPSNPPPTATQKASLSHELTLTPALQHQSTASSTLSSERVLTPTLEGDVPPPTGVTRTSSRRVIPPQRTATVPLPLNETEAPTTPAPVVVVIPVAANAETTATISVAASAIGGAAAAVDAQTIAMVSMVSCATKNGEAKADESMRSLSVVALDDTCEGVIVGNTIVVVAVAGLSAAAVGVLHHVVSGRARAALVRRDGRHHSSTAFDSQILLQAMATLRTPHLLLTVGAYFMNSYAVCGLRVMRNGFSPAWSDTMRGPNPTASLVGALALLFPLLLVLSFPVMAFLFGTRRLLPVRYQWPSRPLSLAGAVALPAWVLDDTIRTGPAFGAVFAAYRRLHPLWSLTSHASFIATLPVVLATEGSGTCGPFFSVSAGLYFVACLVVLALRPRRILLGDVLHAAMLLVNGLVITHSAVLLYHPEEADSGTSEFALVQLSSAVTVLTVLRVVHQGLTLTVNFTSKRGWLKGVEVDGLPVGSHSHHQRQGHGSNNNNNNTNTNTNQPQSLSVRQSSKLQKPHHHAQAAPLSTFGADSGDHDNDLEEALLFGDPGAPSTATFLGTASSTSSTGGSLLGIAQQHTQQQNEDDEPFAADGGGGVVDPTDDPTFPACLTWLLFARIGRAYDGYFFSALNRDGPTGFGADIGGGLLDMVLGGDVHVGFAGNDAGAATHVAIEMSNRMVSQPLLDEVASASTVILSSSSSSASSYSYSSSTEGEDDYAASNPDEPQVQRRSVPEDPEAYLDLVQEEGGENATADDSDTEAVEVGEDGQPLNISRDDILKFRRRLFRELSRRQINELLGLEQRRRMRRQMKKLL